MSSERRHTTHRSELGTGFRGADSQTAFHFFDLDSLQALPIKSSAALALVLTAKGNWNYSVGFPASRRTASRAEVTPSHAHPTIGII